MAEYINAYLILFLLSLLFIFKYMRIYTKQHGIHYIVFGVLACMVNLFYYYAALSNTPEEFCLATQNIYCAMVFIPVIMIRMVCDICNDKKPYLRDIPILFSVLLLISIITNQRFGLFFKNFSIDPATGSLNVVHGIAYYFYFVHVILWLLASIVVLFIYNKKSNVSVFCFLLVQGMTYIVLLSSLIILFRPNRFDFMPVGIIFADIMMLFLCRRLPLYDVSTVIYEAEESSGRTGILVLDKRRRLLGYNPTMSLKVPALTSMKIDTVIPDSFPYYAEIDQMIKELDASGVADDKIVSYDARFYSIKLDKLRMNRRNCGYQLILTDVTEQQNHLRFVENYNEQLKKDVMQATAHIVDMQDSVMLGIAELIESRDNSTGGHIKRTRKVVEILVDELRRENLFEVPSSFYDMLIKAAPLHDLGKIAVDDAVLRKPGRFTPEEFDQMKRHAPEGGKMTRKVLKDINDETIVSIIANVANYHHERWDGSGYPDHLQGESIPLEARIMAVADVYDALVSRRCYKEAFDFEKARSIISEGMGSQFDPNLSECFLNCVSRLEDYYMQEQASDPSV